MKTKNPVSKRELLIFLGCLLICFVVALSGQKLFQQYKQYQAAKIEKSTEQKCKSNIEISQKNPNECLFIGCNGLF